jgi:hypothetical protein
MRRRGNASILQGGGPVGVVFDGANGCSKVVDIGRLRDLRA